MEARQSEDSTVGIFHEGDVLYGKLRPYAKSHYFRDGRVLLNRIFGSEG
jgi:hypothetical protein